MEGSLETLIEEGRAALLAGDNAGARRAFETALEAGDGAAALEGLARAVYLLGDYRASLSFFERAFRAWREAGDDAAAVRTARTIAYVSAVEGDGALMGGWIAQASSVLIASGINGVERAWVDLFGAFSTTDPEEHERGVRAAVEAGRRLGDPDLTFDAIGLLAMHLVATGRIEEGLSLHDEALAAACAGEVRDVFVVEGIFCGMFTSCERTHDVVRAEQWLRAADDAVRRGGPRFLAAHCRAHYGGILTAAGRWTEAEAELAHAMRVYGEGRTPAQSMAHVRLADLRVRQGRLEEAAQLLRGLDQHPDSPGPLAALHHARGETDLARDRLERALADPRVSPSEAGPLLALLVDVLLSGGSIDEASAAAERLAAIAAQQSSAYLLGSAALARGQVCAAAGTDNARNFLDKALSDFARARVPFELERTRLELARTLAETNPAVAISEAKMSLEGFELLRAARHVDAAAALLRTLGAPVRTGPKGEDALTKREAEVLELIGHGLSNPEISDRLYISRKTVGHHVSRILAKLGLRSRTEAAAYSARRSGDRASK